jgi:nucleoid DNA-binding protein
VVYIIECIKRSVIYYNSLSIDNLVDYNIQYRAIKRGYAPTTDTDIKIDNIDNLLKGDIYSIEITFFTI